MTSRWSHTVFTQKSQNIAINVATSTELLAIAYDGHVTCHGIIT